MSTETYADKPMIINFWATWCGPCRIEMPYLQSIQNKYGEQVTVIAVNNAEPISRIIPFIEDLNIKLPIALDPNRRVQDLFGVVAYPTTFFIHSDGTILQVHQGALTLNELEDYVSLLIETS